ncbi:hypothetical protein LAU_0347 [Lausannevirus]|uniref:Uncharacterized protein n=1 Tax=Lausannevirus TaxID=999883 RepID=F2WLS5_9VIRU|nr:hypothetical protein LAU_0347 [Lausannevirus]AEA07198.1 hypothetical protein LAU_0347 [Lausannevirus]
MFSVSRQFSPSPEKAEQRKQDIIERAKAFQKTVMLSEEEKAQLWKNIA